MTLGAFIYFAALALWSAVIAYLLIFKALPYITEKKPQAAQHHAVAHHPAPHHAVRHHEPRRRYSKHEGFRSLAKGESLTIDDIVKGLTQEL